MDETFLAPLGYSSWFPWVGLGLLILIGAWYSYVLLSTRRRAAPSDPFAAAVPDLARLRHDYLQRIDSVDREAASGARSNRSAHQELSLLVRSFVRDAAGVDATRMTLAELRAYSAPPAARAEPGRSAVRDTPSGLPAAADAVAALYPAAFAAGPASSVPDAAPAARKAVLLWN